MRIVRMVLVLFVLAFPVFGQFLRIHPEAPDSDDAIVAEFGGLWHNGCVPQNPRVSLVGPEITIQLEVPLGVCTLNIPPWQHRVTIGTLPPGVYTVTVLVPPDPFRPPQLYVSATFPVSDAEASFKLTPNGGPTGGGTEVFITPGFGACPIDAPCITEVLFDGVAATAVRGFLGGVIATTPEHSAGVVNVEVRRGDSARTTLPAAFTYVGQGRPPAWTYSPVLFPLIFSGPGALGSQWFTEASAFNHGTIPVTPLNDEAVTNCLPNVSPCPAPLFAPRAWDQFHQGTAYPSGLVLWIPRGLLDDLSFSLHVRDLTRNAEDAGTAIPVVREDELKGSSVELLNVPIRPGFRQTLRIYDLSFGPPRTVSVNMFSRTGQFVGFMSLILRPQGCPDSAADCLPDRPLFVSINDFVPRSAAEGVDSVRLDIRTTDPTARLWAFVTVTNNQTQKFTVVAPE